MEYVEQVLEYRIHPKGEHEHLMVYLKLRDDRDPQKWAILDSSNGSACLNRDMEWEYEPLPSSRTDAWKKRCRFSLVEAQDLAKSYLNRQVETSQNW